MPEAYHGKHEATEPEAMLEGMRQGIHDWEQAEGFSAENEAAERATGSAAALDYHMTHQGRLPVAWLEGRAEIPPPIPAHVTPQMITDDIALNMAASVLDAMDLKATAAMLRGLLPEAEGKVLGAVYQEAVGKWGPRQYEVPEAIYPVQNLLGDHTAELPRKPGESGESS